VLAQGKYLRLIDENGWEYVRRHGATGVVLIVAITDDRRLVLVEQFRTSVHRQVVELPAGLVGDTAEAAEESLLVAARRELLEETGFEAEAMVPVAEGPVAVGVSAEVVTFFHATGLKRVGSGGGDATESIVVHQPLLTELPGWLAGKLAAGSLVDPKIYAGLYLVTVARPEAPTARAKG